MTGLQIAAILYLVIGLAIARHIWRTSALFALLKPYGWVARLQAFVLFTLFWPLILGVSAAALLREGRR